LPRKKFKWYFSRIAGLVHRFHEEGKTEDLKEFQQLILDKTFKGEFLK